MGGGGYVTPNVCYVDEVKGMKFNPYIPPPLAIAGDVAYWDGSKVKTTPLSSWSTSLGTPVGVVVVPEGFAPDGRVRIVSLMGVDRNGNQSSSHIMMGWGPTNDTTSTDLTKVPTTDNAGSTSTGYNGVGYLPSDKFTGAQSFVDPKAKYFDVTPYIPSPYLGDSPNPEYYKTFNISIYYNVLSDFNGLSNTETLVSLGTGYTAVNACWKYNDSVSTLQWYLPAIGELGYLMPRFNEINNAITALGGLAVASGNYFWSSSKSNNNAYFMNINTGNVNISEIFEYISMRPFAIL